MNAEKTYAEQHAPEARIMVGGGHMVVLDPPYPFLKDLLQFAHTECVFAPGGELVRRTAIIHMHMPDHKGRLGFPLGFLHRVKAALVERGIPYRVENHPGVPALLYSEEALDAAPSASDRRLLRAVRREWVGRIECDGLNDKAAKVALIARSFPDARIAVVAATRSEAAALSHRLANAPGRNFDLWLKLKSERKWPEERVTVTTPVHLSDRDPYTILLLATPEDLMGDAVIYLLTKVRYERLYALVTPGRSLDVPSAMRLEAFAGPVIHRLAPPPAPVRVRFVRGPADRADESGGTLRAGREMYRRNARRNSLAASVASALLAGDLEVLRHHGVEEADVEGLPPEGERAVAVLVACPEHGRRLAGLLPGWPLLTMSPGCDPVPRHRPSGTGLIVTEIYAAKHPVEADAVVRAGGGAGPLRMRGFPPRVEGGRQAVLVVDIEDWAGPLAADNTRRRRRHYAADGMRVAGSGASG